MNTQKVFGVALTALILTLPGILIYKLEGNPAASTIFLAFLGGLVTTYLLFRKELGLKIDQQIKKQHSWK